MAVTPITDALLSRSNIDVYSISSASARILAPQVRMLTILLCLQEDGPDGGPSNTRLSSKASGKKFSGRLGTLSSSVQRSISLISAVHSGRDRQGRNLHAA